MTRIPATIKRGRLSPDEEAQIIALAERSLSAGRIALKLNRHPATVNFAMHRFGLRVPQPRVTSYVRNGRQVRPFSPEEDAFITALRCQGYALRQISRAAAARFGHERSSATIQTRLLMLANRDDLAGAAA